MDETNTNNSSQIRPANVQGESATHLPKPGLSKVWRWLVFMLFLTLALVVAYALHVHSHVPTLSFSSLPPQMAGITHVQKLGDSQVLPGFPTNFPVYGLVSAEDNYQADSTGKRVLGEKQYLSSLNPDELYSRYKDYFTQAGWPIYGKNQDQLFSYATATTITAYAVKERLSTSLIFISQANNAQQPGTLVRIDMFSDQAH
jgi:hypothetical protein